MKISLHRMNTFGDMIFEILQCYSAPTIPFLTMQWVADSSAMDMPANVSSPQVGINNNWYVTANTTQWSGCHQCGPFFVDRP
uniref:Uncharacterized protein n=1 Tax=Ditylenchus dipsaci TaxID=166011 RepID=A0A915E8J7_9BILA